MLDLLGRAGCVSIEAGVESITDARAATCSTRSSRLTTEEITERLIHAKRHVPFVQANLLDSGADDPGEVEALARASAAARRVGEQAGAAVSLSGLARLHAALGRAGRPRLGAGASNHYLAQFTRVQRHPGSAAAAVWSWNSSMRLRRPR